jgi:hypothetical protein
MAELPTYLDLLRPHEGILHKPIVKDSYLAFKLRSTFGCDTVLLQLRLSRSRAEFSTKALYSQSPVTVTAFRSQTGKGKYAFHFESRPELEVRCLCQVDPAALPRSSTTSTTNLCFPKLRARLALTDYPFLVEGDAVVGRSDLWIGGSLAYAVQDKRIERADVAVGFGEWTLRRYSKFARGLYEIALLRRVSNGVTLAALLQSNGSDFHFLEAGVQMGSVGCRADSLGTVAGWVQGGECVHWRMRVTSRLDRPLAHMCIGLSLELADRL